MDSTTVQILPAETMDIPAGIRTRDLSIGKSESTLIWNNFRPNPVQTVFAESGSVICMQSACLRNTIREGAAVAIFAQDGQVFIVGEARASVRVMLCKVRVMRDQ